MRKKAVGFNFVLPKMYEQKNVGMRAGELLEHCIGKLMVDGNFKPGDRLAVWIAPMKSPL